MPYIRYRYKIDELLKGLKNYNPDVGDLNYIITMLINNFIEKNGKRYENLNSVIGVLECAKMEYYRRIISIYEDKKILENGDVYSDEDE
jgi:hypothetical protein